MAKHESSAAVEGVCQSIMMAACAVHTRKDRNEDAREAWAREQMGPSLVSACLQRQRLTGARDRGSRLDT